MTTTCGLGCADSACGPVMDGPRGRGRRVAVARLASSAGAGDCSCWPPLGGARLGRPPGCHGPAAASQPDTGQRRHRDRRLLPAGQRHPLRRAPSAATRRCAQAAAGRSRPSRRCRPRCAGRASAAAAGRWRTRPGPGRPRTGSARPSGRSARPGAPSPGGVSVQPNRQVLGGQVDPAAASPRVMSRRMLVSCSAMPSASASGLRPRADPAAEHAEREPPDRAGHAPAVVLKFAEGRVAGAAHVRLAAVDQLAEGASGIGNRRAASARARAAT